MLSVVHVVESANAGVGRHVLDLAEGLEERGVRNLVAYCPHSTDRRFRRRLKEGRLSALRLPMPRRNPLGLARSVLGLRSRVRDGRWVVHGHSSYGGLVARLAAWGCAPCVYTPNGIRTLDPGLAAPRRPIIAMVERILSQLTDCTIAVSIKEAGHLKTLIPEGHVEVVLNAVRTFDGPEREEARACLELPAEVCLLGFVGRLAPQKRVDKLLRAFQQAEIAEAEVVLVGAGPLENSLRMLADELGVAERVHWLGNIAGGREGFPFYRAFDTLVIPSDYEGLSYTLLEAIGAGVPIVACEGASSGLLEASEGALGIVVGNDDVAGLGRAMRASLADPPLQPCAGPPAPSFPEMVAQTHDLYLSL